MNILAGVRLANRGNEARAATMLLSTTQAIGAAGSILCIKDAILGKEDIQTRKTLQKAVDEIRKTAFKLQRTRKSQDVTLDQEEANAIAKLGSLIRTGALDIVSSTLKRVGRALFLGVRYAIIPLARALSAAVRVLFRTLMTPQIGLPLATFVGSYLAGKHIFSPWLDKAISSMAGQEYTLGTWLYDKLHPVKETQPAEVKRLEAKPIEIKPAEVPTPAVGVPEVTIKIPQTPLGKPQTPLGKPQTPLGKPQSAGARNVSNNNPGNIKFRGQPGAIGQDRGFAIFDTPENGLYNVARQLQLYNQRGKTTIEELVSVYAPPSENDTNRYIKFLSGRLKVKADTKLDFSDPAQMEALLRAILIQENGHNLPYTDAQYKEAVKRAIAYRGANFKDTTTVTVPVVTTAVATSSDDSLIIPTTGVFTSAFGPRVSKKKGMSTDHKGIDIAGPMGTPIYAANAGSVVKAGGATGYGNLIMVKGASVTTKYGHMRKMLVKEGDRVTKGQLIAEMGNEGIGTGPHLHFEVVPITSNSPVDPALYLSGLPKGKAGYQKLQCDGAPNITCTNFSKVKGKVIQLKDN